MTKPKIADNKPKAVQLKKDEENYWCACGRSNNQPWCDGSHQGTDITPVGFKAEEDGEAYLCMCKHTHNPPYCDGTHAQLKDQQEKEDQQSEPDVADNKPIAVNLKKGEEQYWCACGKSNNQPFCDGSHQVTNITPLAFTPEEDDEAYLCMCKQTNNPPYCDGTHSKLKEKQEITETKQESENSTTEQPTKEEPTLAFIKKMAKEGLKQTGKHGEMVAMGIPAPELPLWNDIQLLMGQMARKPLLDNAKVGTDLTVGPNAKKPLKLDIPLLVSDMSFGALSEEAKIALAKGAQLAGTGICSGEGGMLDEEQEANSRYFFELGSAKFGFSWDMLDKVQAFHFKGGQAAKTGTGGHLPANKVKGKIARVRKLEEGKDAISPSTFKDLHTPEDFKEFADKVREKTGGIPIGFKLSANHIEEDIQFALDAGTDYIIIDGRGGATGAAPAIFRDNISIPTIPALARARKYLDEADRKDITLIATGGLRTPADFVKALALGADGVAVANAALHAIGCVAARICNTNNCPAGVATQKPELRKRLNIDKSAQQLDNFLRASAELMQLLARGCGYDHLNKFNANDLTTWKKEMAELSGIRFAGMG